MTLSPKNVRLFFLAILNLLLFLAPAHAGKRLHIIELKHVFAEDVLPVIRPHLPAGSSASAYDNKLLLNIDDQELNAIETIVAQLDNAPQRLILSVRQRREGDGQTKQNAADIQLSDQGIKTNMRLQHQTMRDQDNAAQRVQTVSGQAAFLQTGVDIPMLTAHYSPYSGVSLGTAYLATGTGFFVLARVNGNNVQVQINPEQSQARTDGSIQVNVMQTEVRGQLGEWIALGGSDQEQNQRQQSIRTQIRAQWLVEIKVEAVH